LSWDRKTPAAAAANGACDKTIRQLTGRRESIGPNVGEKFRTKKSSHQQCEHDVINGQFISELTARLARAVGGSVLHSVVAARIMRRSLNDRRKFDVTVPTVDIVTKPSAILDRLAICTR